MKLKPADRKLAIKPDGISDAKKNIKNCKNVSQIFNLTQKQSG